MKTKAILLLLSYLLVVLHGMIPHHHHGDMLVDTEIAHVHGIGHQEYSHAEYSDHSHAEHLYHSHSDYSHHDHSHSEGHSQYNEHSHSASENSNYTFGDQLVESNVPDAHHHNHIHFLSNGFAHVERSCSETEYEESNKLPLPLLLVISNDEGRYFCRDEFKDYIEEDIACPSILFNNVKPLRGPPFTA